MKRLIAGFMAFCMITALCADYHPQTSASAEELSAGAVSGNAIDTVYFGDTTSETEHNFTNNLNYSSNSVAGVDDGTLSDGLGDGLTFRYLTPPGGDKLSMIQFTLKASITEQNYLTIRLSGSQGEHGNLLLLGENGDKSVINPIMMTAWGELDSAWGFGEDKVPYEGRYYYDTYIIPSNMVKSNGTVTLCIAATGVSNPYGSGTWDKQIMNSKYIYSAATHTNAYYKPADNLDSAHRAPAHNPAVTDQATINQNYTELSNQLNAAMEKVMSWQLYGDYWNTNIKNSSNAYLEGAVISLHDIKQYSSFMYKKYTKAQWAKIATQFGVNFQNWEVFGTTSLYVTALTNSYSGARYYENTDFLNRIFSTYDFIERAQEASGGWCIPSSGDEAFTWYGADYYGTGERKTTAYYTPLMKLGSDFLVQSFLELCNYIKNCDNAELKAAFYTKLNEKIDGDLTGRNNRTRRDYYIDMFAKLRNFLNNPNGKDFYDPDSKAGTLNQDFGFAYTANEAVRLLYDTATPGARLNTKYAPANPKEYIQQIKYKFGEMVDGQKWFSANGLGLEGGASHGGWAGDYGALVLKQVTHYAEIGQYFEDAEIKDLFNKTAYDLYNAASYFMYDSVDTATRNSVLTSEVTASSRNNGYTQKLFYNLAGYVATTLGNDAALRVMQKFIEDNRAATNTIMEATTSVHVYDNLTTEQEIVKYYQKIAETIGNPSKPTAYLPMEEENTNNFVWYDYDGQVVVVKNTLADGTVDRGYFTLNYKRHDWSYNGITRIHFTSGDTTTAGKSDRIANVVTKNEGGVYSYADTSLSGKTYIHHRYNGYSQVKYGDYIVAMNQSMTDTGISQTGQTYTLDTTGVKRAVNLVTGTEYISQNGEDITVTANERTVVVLYVKEYVEPVKVTETYSCGDTMLGYKIYNANKGDSVTVAAPTIDGYGLADNQTSAYTIIAKADNTQNTVNFEYVVKGKPVFTVPSGSNTLASWSTSLTNNAVGSVAGNADGSLTLTANTVDNDNMSKVFAYQEVTDDFSINSTLDSVLYKISDHDYYSVIITDGLDLMHANYIELRYWLNNSNIGLCYHDSTMAEKTNQFGWAVDKNGLNSGSISGITFDVSRIGDKVSYKYSLDGGATYKSLTNSSVDFASLSGNFFQSNKVYVGVALTSGVGDGTVAKASNVVTVSDLAISGGVAKDPVALGTSTALDFTVTDSDGAAINGLNMDDLNDTTYYNNYQFTPSVEGSYEIKAVAYNSYNSELSSKTELVKVGAKQHTDLAEINDIVVTTGNTATFTIPQNNTTQDAAITCITYQNENVVPSSFTSNSYTFTPTQKGTYQALVKYDFGNYIVTRIVEITAK